MSRLPKDYRENPVYGTDFSRPVSVIIEELRNKMAELRGTIIDIKCGYPHWSGRIDCVEGLLTCGLVTLHNVNEEVIGFEINVADADIGPSLKFSPRGIGLDVCPCCFVCGTQERNQGSNHYLNNIAAFVDSKEEGEKIVGMFNGKARLDYREREPNRIQLKVGACDKHLPNLELLYNTTKENHGRIRQKNIIDAVALVP
jgi:hypothetical protein